MRIVSRPSESLSHGFGVYSSPYYLSLMKHNQNTILKANASELNKIHSIKLPNKTGSDEKSESPGKLFHVYNYTVCSPELQTFYWYGGWSRSAFVPQHMLQHAPWHCFAWTPTAHISSITELWTENKGTQQRDTWSSWQSIWLQLYHSDDYTVTVTDYLVSSTIIIIITTIYYFNVLYLGLFYVWLRFANSAFKE